MTAFTITALLFVVLMIKCWKPANTHNRREKTGHRAGGQKGHARSTLTKSRAEEKIRSGRCQHEIKTIGNSSGQDYVKKLRKTIFPRWKRSVKKLPTNMQNRIKRYCLTGWKSTAITIFCSCTIFS
jgi:hypothetical protein